MTKQNKKPNKENFFKRSSTIAVFAAIAFIGGIAFLDQRSTGNIIINKYQQFNALSIIGALLILCSIILVGYYAHKRK